MKMARQASGAARLVNLEDHRFAISSPYLSRNAFTSG